MGQWFIPDPAADAVPSFEDDHRRLVLVEPERDGEPGVSRSEDADIGVEPLGHVGPLGSLVSERNMAAMPAMKGSGFEVLASTMAFISGR